VKTADAVIEAEVDAASEAFGELSGLAGALSVAEHREPDARASGLSVRLGKRPRTGRKGKNTGLIIGLIAGGAGVVLLAVLGATFFVLASVAETGPTSTSLDPETLAPAYSWQEFSLLAGNFRVRLPGDRQNLETPNSFGARWTSPSAQFMVHWEEIPADVPRQEMERRFNEMRDKVVAHNPGIRVYDDQPRTVQGFLGRTYRHADQNGEFCTLMVAGNGRFYSLVAGGERVPAVRNAMEQFLDSFEILDDSGARAAPARPITLAPTPPPTTSQPPPTTDQSPPKTNTPTPRRIPPGSRLNSPSKMLRPPLRRP